MPRIPAPEETRFNDISIIFVESRWEMGEFSYGVPFFSFFCWWSDWIHLSLNIPILPVNIQSNSHPQFFHGKPIIFHGGFPGFPWFPWSPSFIHFFGDFPMIHDYINMTKTMGCSIDFPRSPPKNVQCAPLSYISWFRFAPATRL